MFILKMQFTNAGSTTSMIFGHILIQMMPVVLRDLVLHLRRSALCLWVLRDRFVKDSQEFVTLPHSILKQRLMIIVESATEIFCLDSNVLQIRLADAEFK
jgi:hypothetical protein